MIKKSAKEWLKNAAITHISLCRRGKNGLRTILKSGGRLQSEMLCSKMTSDGLLHAMVWAPDVPDADGQAMTSAEVTKMAHKFLSNGGNIDVEHNLNALSTEQIQIAETLIIQKGDKRFSDMTYGGKTVKSEGAWGVVLKILDPELKAAYESGDWDGVSMFGMADVSSVGKSDDEPLTNSPEDTPMTPEQFQALLDAIKASNAAVDPAPIAPAVVPVAASTAPKFEGDPSDPKQVEAHLAALKLSKVDMNDPQAVEAHLASINKSDDKDKDKSVKKSDGDGDGDGDSPAVILAKAALVKAQKASNQPVQKDEGEGDAKAEALAKSRNVDPEISALMDAGRSIGDRYNKKMGFTEA